MPEPPPPTRARDFLTLAGLGLGMLGIFMMASGAYVLWNRYSVTKDWTAAEAEVVSGTLYSRTSKNEAAIPAAKMWGAHFLVRYHAGNATIDSLADMGYLSASQAEMEHWLHVFQPGSHHTVRYDPFQPGRVVLTGNHVWQTYPGPARIFVAGVALMVIAAVLIRLARRPAPQPVS